MCLELVVVFVREKSLARRWLFQPFGEFRNARNLWRGVAFEAVIKDRAQDGEFLIDRRRRRIRFKSLVAVFNQLLRGNPRCEVAAEKRFEMTFPSLRQP